MTEVKIIIWGRVEQGRANIPREAIKAINYFHKVVFVWGVDVYLS